MIYGNLGSSIKLDGNVNIQIGGISGLNVDIPQQNFKSYKLKNTTFYTTIKNRNETMVISSKGEFWVYLKELNLADVLRNKWGQIYVQIGSKKGSTTVTLKCNKNICTKEK